MLVQAFRLTGLGVCGTLASIALVSACGSDGSDGPRGNEGASSTGASSASGGSNAGSSSGGTSAAGSNNGGTANGGTAGNSEQVVTECPGVVPSDPAVADFEMTPGAGEMYEWGSAAQGTDDFWGSTFNYPDAVTVTVEDGALTAAGNVAEYAGFGLYVQNCADASSFEGVRFTISGDPPDGKMRFAVQTNKNEWATGMKGSCLAPDAQKYANCVHPSVEIDVTDEPTVIEVKWADLGGGKPAADAKTDGSDIIGLQWILPWVDKMEAYDTSVTIDDVEFIGEGSGAGGSGAGGAGAGGAPSDAMGGAGGAN